MIGVALWLLGSCGGPASSPPRVPAHPDVLLITLDTVRADRIGAYGHAAASTPNLDALAARGRRYTHAWSPVPFTIPAHASILTGLYPARHGIRANGDAVLGDDATTLAERLRDAGFRTAAAVAAFPTTRVWGFDQGFDAFFDEVPAPRSFWHGERPAGAVVDDLVDWVGDLGDDPAPRFVWAHFFDAHHPYAPPEPWASAHPDPYDGEIAAVDAQIGRLLEAFGRPTLVVVVADHGESLGEHGELGHGLYVYDGTQRVPFVVAGPGVAPEVVDRPASLVDVVPVVLTALGLPVPDGLDGTADPAPDRAVWMESWQLATRFGLAPHLGVVAEGHKLVSLPRPELYALADDPREVHDRAGEDPDRVERLRARLEAFGFGPPSSDPAHPASLDVTAQLRALGYVDDGLGVERDGPPEDPKDHADMLGLVQKRERFEREGRAGEVLAVDEELATRWPDVPEFLARRAHGLAVRGRMAEALALLDRGLAQDPDHAVLMQTQAVLLAMGGRHDEAALRFQQVAEAMPFAPRVRAMAIHSLLQLPEGKDLAVELGLEYLRRYPDDHHVAGLLGIELARRGELTRALALLEQGARADIPERDVARHLAAARIGQGRFDEARALLEAEIRHHPWNLAARATLMAQLGRRGEWEAQAQVASAILALAERSVAGREVPRAVRIDAHLARAQALFNLKRHVEARAALDLGLAEAPEDPRLHVLDANLLAREGRREEALGAFELARSLAGGEGG